MSITSYRITEMRNEPETGFLYVLVEFMNSGDYVIHRHDFRMQVIETTEQYTGTYDDEGNRLEAGKMETVQVTTDQIKALVRQNIEAYIQRCAGKALRPDTTDPRLLPRTDTNGILKRHPDLTTGLKRTLRRLDV